MLSPSYLVARQMALVSIGIQKDWICWRGLVEVFSSRLRCCWGGSEDVFKGTVGRFRGSGWEVCWKEFSTCFA